MDGRKRTVQIKFRVTEAERDLILEKMKLVPTRNMAAYQLSFKTPLIIIQIAFKYRLNLKPDYETIRHQGQSFYL